MWELMGVPVGGQDREPGGTHTESESRRVGEGQHRLFQVEK